MNSKAYIEESAIIDWRNRLTTLNEDSITLLNEYQNKVNELDEHMKGNVSEGFIRDETNVIKENISFHNNMKDLDKLLNTVIEKMNSY